MKTLITYCFIMLSLCMMFTGCYSENKAHRQLFKVNSKYPQVVTKHCADIFPEQSFSVDSVVYIQGDVVTALDTVYISDTIAKVVTKNIVHFKRRTDTVFRLRNLQTVNKAKELLLTAENQKISTQLAKEQKENNILFWAVIVLGGYTILRWIVRFWGIRLP